MAESPNAARIPQLKDPAETPKASAIPEERPTLIDVPITAKILGPGLAIANKNAAWDRKMPGR
jgi:hypothetical protein